MNFNQYQNKAASTAIYPEEVGLFYTVLGLTNEAGEVAGVVKKMLRDANGELRIDIEQKIAAELGDVLWYVAMVAKEIGYTLDTIATDNIKKLHSREQRGKLGGSGDAR
jgi:NTP pyrophosphatase (non-canonical NTP hydrolase)